MLNGAYSKWLSTRFGIFPHTLPVCSLVLETTIVVGRTRLFMYFSPSPLVYCLEAISMTKMLTDFDYARLATKLRENGGFTVNFGNRCFYPVTSGFAVSIHKDRE